MRRISRRHFLGTAGAALAAPWVVTSKVRAEAQRRVVILGFDGVEPSIIEAMIEAGELPHLAQLRQQGSFSKLGSTIPPQSPVAWSSFATGRDPGGHGIYDFIRRTPNTPGGPLPGVGTGRVDPIRLDAGGALAEAAEAESFRKGTSFWKCADSQGLRCRVLNVPFAFPPDKLENGVQLCGLGVPDLRGSTSTFVLLDTEVSQPNRVSGGLMMPLMLDGSGLAQASLPGPRDERQPYSSLGAFATAEVAFAVDRKAGKGTATCGGDRVELVQGEWSGWLPCRFVFSDSVTVWGLTRFFPLEISEARVRIYSAAMQYHPEHPYAPISEPSRFSGDLAGRYGLYKTVGWAYDTHAVRQDVLPEEAFLRDTAETMSWRERLTLDEMDRGEWDLLISGWTGTDRIGHIFWRFRDPGHPLYDPALAERFGKTLEHCYKKADLITGKVMEKLRPDDLLFVLSDHGFGTWRTGFGINTWLRGAGELSVSDPAKAERGFLQGIDWKQTRAYAVGLSSVYLNLEGRETFGSVSPGEAAKARAELKERLMQVKDPANGKSVFSRIYTREDFQSGEAIDDAPDLVLGYAPQYQSTKDAAKGAVGDALFEPNTDKWSGEHAATDRALLPGMLFCNKIVEAENPSIRDLGPTALKALGRDTPAGSEGTALV